MVKKIEITTEDQQLFQAVTKGIKPIISTKVLKEPVIPPKKRKSPKEQQTPEFPENFSDYETLPALGPDDLMYFARPGLQHKILRKLRGGKYNVEATLDLHGQTALEARETLHHFLLHCHDQGKKHLLIIHGKGHNTAKPVLKNKLNHWLRETDLILAFCSATMRDGRSGSVYVLLKGGT